MESDGYLFKQLMIFKGERLSLQHHEKKTETIYIAKGFLNLKVDGVQHWLKPGDYYTIRRGEIHRMEAGSEDVLVLEASTPHLDDVVRHEDDYGRG